MELAGFVKRKAEERCSLNKFCSNTSQFLALPFLAHDSK